MICIQITALREFARNGINRRGIVYGQDRLSVCIAFGVLSLGRCGGIDRSWTASMRKAAPAHSGVLSHDQ